MKTLKCAVFVLAVAALAAGCASTQAASTNPNDAAGALGVPADYKGPVAERPVYMSGDRWSFSHNGVAGENEFIRYEGTAGKSPFLVKIARGGDTYFWLESPDTNVIGKLDASGKPLWKHNGEYAMFRFPLYVGKKWDEVYYSQGNTARQMRVWVTGWEQVKVPAGTFWAFKLEATNRRLDMTRPVYETYWYAPEVKKFIRYTSRGFELELELLNYHLTPRPVAP